MNINNKLFIVGLILLVILTVSVVSAADNETTLNQPTELNEINTVDDYNAKIIAKNVTFRYSEFNEFTAYLKDDEGFEIYGENLKIRWADGTEEDLYEYDDSDGYNTYIDKGVGNYKLTVFLENSYFNAKPVNINVKITKATPKLTLKEYYTTQNQYATLKATVRDRDGYEIDEGYVKFTIDGKSYKVKVDYGVATKKVKLSKAKTYTYTATFYSDNYYNKTSSSKVYVLSTSKSARTFYIKEYKIILKLNQYKKLVDAKNTNELVYYELKTSKYFKQTYETSKTTYKWVLHKKGVYPYSYYYWNHDYKVKNLKKIWISDGEYNLYADIYKKVYSTKIIKKTVKARVSIGITYGGKTGGQNAIANKYYMYLTTPYQNPGYDDCYPWLYGSKTSNGLKSLNSAAVRRY